jgi:hypothetical protein
LDQGLPPSIIGVKLFVIFFGHHRPIPSSAQLRRTPQQQEVLHRRCASMFALQQIEYTTS